MILIFIALVSKSTTYFKFINFSFILPILEYVNVIILLKD